MAEGRSWACPPRAQARIAAIVDAANREIAGIVSGVKAALDIPDAAVLTPDGDRFVLPPGPSDNGRPPELEPDPLAGTPAEAG